MESKRKVAIINAVPYGSTGKIVRGISDIASYQDWETFTCYSWTKSMRKSSSDSIMVGSFIGKVFHILLGRLTGFNGCFSWYDTWKLIRRLEKFQPDVINLHILHNWNINLPMLFSYIKKNNISVVWTMHDCWAFTGQCPHFVMVNCDKWKTGCYGCLQYREYPQAYVDQTKKMWALKKKWFTGVKNMTIVTPSQWLADLVAQSYLSEYPVEVINNGVDLSVFKPTDSDFRKKYHCEDKTILLGVAFGWGRRKGLDVFIELAHRLDERYQIVLVGTDNNTDKQLPENIISIHRTQNQQELAEIYTAADVFVNPTREDTYPTVNMEALACGTPVITFKTGGSPEIVNDTCGKVVNCNDLDGLLVAIMQCIENDATAYCVESSRLFCQKKCYLHYIQLFDCIMRDKDKNARS